MAELNGEPIEWTWVPKSKFMGTLVHGATRPNENADPEGGETLGDGPFKNPEIITIRKPGKLPGEMVCTGAMHGSRLMSDLFRNSTQVFFLPLDLPSGKKMRIGPLAGELFEPVQEA